ncbi:hypothetical protein AAMO2058_000035100 [Amorphochlora amoebiformis]
MNLFDFNENEFVDAFSISATGKKQKNKIGEQQSKNKKRKTDDVKRVLDSKTSQSVAIMLKSLPGIEQTYYAILQMDKDVLNEDKLTKIIGALPKPDELAQIKAEEKKDANVKWDKPERYFKIIAKIPTLALRLRTWKFTVTITTSLEETTQILMTFTAACEALQKSTTLVKLLSVVLTVGNYLNGKTKRGQADGFDIKVLRKLRDTKGLDGHTTLLKFVAETCQRIDASIKDRLNTELRILNKTGNIPEFKEIDSMVNALESMFKTNVKNAGKVSNAIKNAPEEIKRQDRFAQVVDPFFEKAKKQVNNMLFERKQAKCAYEKVADYFSDAMKDTVKLPSSTEFLGTFRDLVSAFSKAWPEDVKAVEKPNKMKLQQLGAKAMINALKKGIPKLRTIKKGGKSRGKKQKQYTST